MHSCLYCIGKILLFGKIFVQPKNFHTDDIQIILHVTCLCTCVYLYADLGPTSGNIENFCSVVLDRSTIAYDITFHLRFDETFTPAVISAIDSLRAGSFQINSNGDVIFAVATRRNIFLNSSVTQGPFTLNVRFDDFGQLANGLGYNFSVST